MVARVTDRWPSSEWRWDVLRVLPAPIACGTPCSTSRLRTGLSMRRRGAVTGGWTVPLVLRAPISDLRDEPERRIRLTDL